MGLLSIAKKATKRVIKAARPFITPTVTAFAGGTAGQIVATALGEPRPGAPALPALPPGISPIPGIPRLPPLTRPLPKGPGGMPIVPRAPGMACPSGFHPAKDGTGRCVRNRRMNPMNPRAARRAIRRIKMARKMLQEIERQLPKQRTRARAFPGHRARLTHE